MRISTGKKKMDTATLKERVKLRKVTVPKTTGHTSHFDSSEGSDLKLEQDVLVTQADNDASVLSMNNLAVALFMNGRCEEAIELQKTALKWFKNEQPVTLHLKDNLAAFLLVLEQYEEAEQLLEELLAIRTQQMEAYHPDRVTTMNHFIVCLDAVGKDERVQELVKEKERIREELLALVLPAAIKECVP
mgnify:CR=1 FL=1